jgi:hypothetical protein
MVSRLSDDQVRGLLLEQLDKAAAADRPATPPSLIEELEESGKVVRTRLAAVLGAAPRIPETLALPATRLADNGGLGHALLVLAIVLVAGLAARWLWHRRVAQRQQDRIAARNVAAGAFASIAVFGDAFIWFLLELSGVAIFYGVALTLLFAFWYDVEALRVFLTTYVSAVGVTLAVVAFTEFYLPRDWPIYRLMPLSDAATLRVKAFVLTLAIIWTFGLFSCRLLLGYGADRLPYMLLLIAVSTLFVVVLIALLLSVRREIADLIRGAQADTGGWAHVRKLLAASWHVIAGGYVVLLWGLSMSRGLLTGGEGAGGIGPGLIGLALVIFVPAIDIVIGHYLAARFGRESAFGGAIRRTLRVLLVVGAAAIFLNLWGVDIDRLEAAGIAGWMISAALDVGTVALIGYAAWQLMRAYFDTVLARGAPDTTSESRPPMAKVVVRALRPAQQRCCRCCEPSRWRRSSSWRC